MFRFQSVDEDCTLEEEDDGLIEEEDEIDQFNDDTFGAGAIDDDWQEEHKRLAELDERDGLETGLGLGGPEMGAETNKGEAEDSISMHLPSSDIHVSSLKFSSPSHPPPSGHPLMSIIKEVGLPKRPLQGRNDEGQDLSERVPPPRSSSPVIGSPPVRAVPIGTPPKQPISHSLNHQIHHPMAVHVRAPVQHRYPAPFPERLSPNTILNIISQLLLRGVVLIQHFLYCDGTLLNHESYSRWLLLSLSQVAGFPRGGPAPPLLPGSGGFRPFFGGPPPLHGHRMGPPPPHGPANHTLPIRHNATHLHPQHRRMLTQRMQNRVGDRGRPGGDRRSRDPYSNLMTQKEKEWVTKIQMMQLQSTDPYLDDYYYQNYYEKMEKRQERERDSSKKEHTTKLITPQVAKVEHSYRPVQFAGSLGKLTVSSVNNPRKMIDAVVTARTDDEKRDKQVWNKRRQILYTVEKMYSLLLEVQDFEKRFVQAPEEDRDALLEHKILKTLIPFFFHFARVSDEQCVMIMSVRKGKRLISRLLSFLPPPQATAVVMAIARNFPALAKKDKQDQVLCWLVEPVSAVIHSLSSSVLTDLLQELQGNEGQMATVLHNKFGVTLLYLILSEGERMQSSNPNCQLMDDNRWTELVFSVTRELLSIPSASLSAPLFTPPNLLSLLSRYVDRQRLELLQEKIQ
uniref:Protein PAT1 homolog 1 n=1 Tax=Mola mola TaxID=94237 RepID=A0A3Q3WZF1_MOLML